MNESKRVMGFSSIEVLRKFIKAETIRGLVESAYQTGAALEYMSLLGKDTHNGFPKEDYLKQMSLIRFRAEELDNERLPTLTQTASP